MKRLRRKEPFGKAGLTVAVCALVMALVGGAYAAGGLTKSQEKQVTKIAKKYAGKPGAPGTNGTNGGPGEKGAPGTNGTPGAPGKGVVITNTASSCGAAGGHSVEVEDSGVKTPICNGEEGEPGVIHPGETLPSEVTLKGHWAASGFGEEGYPGTGGAGVADAAASYGIPLSEVPTIHYIAEGVTTLPTGCTGSVAEPGADPGFLCVFANTEFNAFNPELESADKNGFRVRSFTAAKGPIFLEGTWAVTAE